MNFVSERTPSHDRLLAIRSLAAWAPRLRDDGEASPKGPTVLKKLVDAARRRGAQAREEFKTAVQRSGRVLSPLSEPLVALDFTEHRWMAGHREEAYSDRLQWIMVQSEPAEVLRVVGVNDPEIVSACTECPVTITRERRVAHGHEGASGRLDLEIKLGDAVLLVVEVKLGEAESADTEKGIGYCESVEAEHADWKFKKYVILVLDAADEEYCQFKPRLWADACVELRLMATRFCARSEHLRAAMILAFVAAVEQNLLRLRPARGGAHRAIDAALTLPPLTDHITRFLEAFENVQNCS